MENNTHTLPSLSPMHSPTNPSKALSLSPSLPQPSATVPASLPLSPPSLPQSSPSHFLQSSGGFKSHCLSSSTPSDQDDLTCLNWLHQRNILPLSKMPLLPQFEMPPILNLPSSPGKPPYSFSSLIFMAIEDSPDKRLPVRGIYEWIVNNFPYYRTAPSGWRNSVRHNLSLSKSFHRMQRDKSQVCLFRFSSQNLNVVLMLSIRMKVCYFSVLTMKSVLLITVHWKGVTVVCLPRISSSSFGGA